MHNCRQTVIVHDNNSFIETSAFDVSYLINNKDVKYLNVCNVPTTFFNILKAFTFSTMILLLTHLQNYSVYEPDKTRISISSYSTRISNNACLKL